MLVNIIRQQFYKLKLYKESVLVNTVFSVLAIYMLISLYELLPDHNYSQRELLKYVIWSVILEQALATIRIPLFCKNVKKGLIAKYYRFPVAIYEQFICEECGETVFGLLANLPVLLFGLLYSFHTFRTLFFFLISLVLSLILSILVTLDIYSITFVVWNYKSSKAILTAVSGILSGAMIPLVLLPEWFRKIAYYTPFSYMIDFPIQILLGERNVLFGIILQCIWIALFYLTGKAVYKIVETKVTIYGG